MTELLEVMTFLVEAWDKPDFTKAKAAIYKTALEDENPENLMQAVKNLVKTSKWRPTLPEIFEEVSRIQAREMALDPVTYYWQMMGAFNDSLAGRVEPDYPYQLRGAEKYLHAPALAPEGWQP